MRLLLDTHIWLWSLLEPSRLGPHLRRELVNQQNELWLSPVSAWEALILNAKGRFRLPADVRGWMAQAIGNLREAPLTHQIAIASQQLPWPHPDPVDRFLAATAQVLDLTLVTADARLLGLGEIKTLANR